jgi:hypothetical protein
MSDISTVLADNIKSLQSSALHYKIYYIILFVSAGFMVVLGIPMLFAFGLGLIYIAIGVFYIFAGLILKKAQESIAKIANNLEISQEEYNQNSIEAITQTGKHFKLMNIFMLVSLILGIVGGIVGGIAFVSLLSNPDFNKALNSSYNTNSLRSSSPSGTIKKTSPMMNSINGAGGLDINTPDATMTVDKNGNMKMQTTDGKTIDITTSQKSSDTTSETIGE